MIQAVNSFRPDVLFVGMTAPKQEKWLHKHKARIDARVMCAIGGAFDFYAGTIPRAPKWMIRYGIEWLFRLAKEPQRMWRRNFISTPYFILKMLSLKWRPVLAPRASTHSAPMDDFMADPNLTLNADMEASIRTRVRTNIRHADLRKNKIIIE